MDSTSRTANPELTCLDAKIEEQSRELAQWRLPSEALIFETLRAIDFAYCEELFTDEENLDFGARLHRSHLTWGINRALDTLMPDELMRGPFRQFRSKADTQDKTDFFLLQSGILERAVLLRSLLAEGLLLARLETPPQISPLIRNILVLKTSHPSLLQQAVSRTQRLWLIERFRERDDPWERDLERRHLEFLPMLEKQVELVDGWGMNYSSTSELDRYFLEWGQIYLRRMWSQDLLGPDERIGGNQFNDYLTVLAALSGRSHKHLCCAAILKDRHPGLDLRNLLTSFASCNGLLVSLARFLDSDTLYIQKLLASLTLEPANKAHHVRSGHPAWAPIVRVSHDHCMLPMYGLEINPFLFLLNDLEARYPKEWFQAANNREARWLGELKALFNGRRWQVAERPVILKDGARVVTDIDFLVHDSESGETALFQLKWQKPAGVDTRTRRSMAKNLITEGNRWIAAVTGWLDRNGMGELGRRAGIEFKPSTHVQMFVLARYEAMFPGVAQRSEAATWSDWAHFLRVMGDNRRASPRQLSHLLQAEASRIQAEYEDESTVMPLGDLSIILNPSHEPDRASP